MNTTLIEIDPEQARQKLRAYRARVHKDAEETYSMARKAYQAAADGYPLIELSRAIQEGGFFPDMRPRLAIARADRFEVFFSWDYGETNASFIARTKREPTMATHQSASLSLNVEMGRRHGQLLDPINRRIPMRVRGFARVPMVPADKRPHSGQLRDWHILWEVEQWSDRSHGSPPPRDPYLLKHVAGDLWAVLAEWDLTDLERAVMRGVITR